MTNDPPKKRCATLPVSRDKLNVTGSLLSVSDCRLVADFRVHQVRPPSPPGCQHAARLDHGPVPPGVGPSVTVVTGPPAGSHSALPRRSSAGGAGLATARTAADLMHQGSRHVIPQPWTGLVGETGVLHICRRCRVSLRAAPTRGAQCLPGGQINPQLRDP